MNEPSATHTVGASGRSRTARRLLTGLGVIVGGLLVIWATLATYYSNLPWFGLRLTLAVGCAAFSVWALWLDGRPRMRVAFAGLVTLVIAWEISIQPSHDRPWRAEVAVLPRAVIDGDRVRITGVRNFEYRSVDDFTARYVERELSLAHLTSVDFYISYWQRRVVAHTFVSFNFDNAPPVCISIEARPEQGEAFAAIPSLFKQFELIYVVGEERDLVRVRTEYRNEEVYRYPLVVSSAAAQRLFLVYLDRINGLADRPEWYHLLKNNCTINIARYANAAGREGRFDIRSIINGWADRALYDAKLVDGSMPFDELRQRSRIDEIAREVGDAPDFSRRIRSSAP